MFLLQQHPTPYFGMVSLSGNTVSDVMLTVACGNCHESVPIPSSLVKKHMQRVNSQKLRVGTDNHSFRTRKIMLYDKLDLHRLDLEFIFQALKETRDPHNHEDLSKKYMKGQARYLSLMQEAVYMQKALSDMVEDTTIETSAIARRHIKTCDSYDKDLMDIRRTLDYLKKENENFKRVQIAAANFSRKMVKLFSTADQYLTRDRSSISARSQQIGHQHSRSRRSSVTEQSTTPEQHLKPDQPSSKEKSMKTERPLTAQGSPIRSRSSLPNRLSGMNGSSNTGISANENETVYRRMSESSLSTRNLSIARRAPTDASNANETAWTQRSPLVQELPVDLDIEDSELLFEP